MISDLLKELQITPNYLSFEKKTNKIGLDAILWPLDQLASLQGQILSNKCGHKRKIYNSGKSAKECLKTH